MCQLVTSEHREQPGHMSRAQPALHHHHVRVPTFRQNVTARIPKRPFHVNEKLLYLVTLRGSRRLFCHFLQVAETVSWRCDFCMGLT